MKKNKFWWAICFVFAMYSCSECMEDEAEKINKGKVDTNENYILNSGAYTRDRRIIDSYSEQIFGEKLSLGDALPETIDTVKDSQKNSNFFQVNNNIVLFEFFSCCFQEKIFLDLIIGELKNKNLEKQFKDILKNFKTEIEHTIKNFSTENQTAYSQVTTLNDTFNKEVLKKILPQVIGEIKNDTNFSSKFENGKLDKYADMNYMFGISHILLSKLISERSDRERKIQEKYSVINFSQM